MGAINHVAVTNWSGRPDAEIVSVVEAARVELPAFCDVWGLPIPGIQFYDQSIELALQESIIVSAVDDDGNPSSLGYHTVLAGTPLFLWEAGAGAWVFFHELYEILVNPQLDRWAPAPDGRLWWVEACDACQADSHTVEVLSGLSSQRTQVQASNYLKPAFFGLKNYPENPSAPYDPAPYDRLGLVPAPFTLSPGGYTETTRPDGKPERLGASRPDKGRTSSRTDMLRGRCVLQMGRTATAPARP